MKKGGEEMAGGETVVIVGGGEAIGCCTIRREKVNYGPCSLCEQDIIGDPLTEMPFTIGFASGERIKMHPACIDRAAMILLSMVKAQVKAEGAQTVTPPKRRAYLTTGTLLYYHDDGNVYCPGCGAVMDVKDTGTFMLARCDACDTRDKKPGVAKEAEGARVTR